MEGSGRPRRTEEEGQLEEIREEERRRVGEEEERGGGEGKGYPGNLDKTTNALWMEGKTVPCKHDLAAIGNRVFCLNHKNL